MKNKVTNLLSSMVLTEAQSYKNITVFPLVLPGNGVPPYIVLTEAMFAQALLITEISQDGSVPNLKVNNRGQQKVLLIDGEELAGAKQNRVLNTSILLREASETTIPVSCTEQGRWSYSSEAFSESGVVMAQKSRARKSRSVSESLSGGAHFSSDQGEVWAQIHELHAKSHTHSPTGAMRDVFEARRNDLAECLAAFRPVFGQNGLLVLVAGEVCGLDLVSSPEAYQKLHEKLLKSYIIEALFEPKESQDNPVDSRARADAFLEEICQCEATVFPSVGQGSDVRFSKPSLAGSALVADDKVVHCAFFRLTAQTENFGMAPSRQRMRWF